MALLGGHTRKKKKRNPALQVLILSGKTEFISICSAGSRIASVAPLRIASALTKTGAPKVGSCTPANVQDDPLGSREKILSTSIYILFIF